MPWGTIKKITIDVDVTNIEMIESAIKSLEKRRVEYQQRALMEEIERLREENKRLEKLGEVLAHIERLEKLLADEGICLTCGCRGCDCQEGDQ